MDIARRLKELEAASLKTERLEREASEALERTQGNALLCYSNAVKEWLLEWAPRADKARQLIAKGVASEEALRLVASAPFPSYPDMERHRQVLDEWLAVDERPPSAAYEIERVLGRVLLWKREKDEDDAARWQAELRGEYVPPKPRPNLLDFVFNDETGELSDD